MPAAATMTNMIITIIAIVELFIAEGRRNLDIYILEIIEILLAPVYSPAPYCAGVFGEQIIAANLVLRPILFSS